jgi:hypothetical protein
MYIRKPGESSAKKKAPKQRGEEKLVATESNHFGAD